MLAPVAGFLVAGLVCEVVAYDRALLNYHRHTAVGAYQSGPGQGLTRVIIIADIDPPRLFIVSQCYKWHVFSPFRADLQTLHRPLLYIGMCVFTH
jgi:hypothetical protein